MYKGLRNLHKWAGLAGCLFLMVISVSGFFLSIKGKIDWMRPKTHQGTVFGHPDELLPVADVMDAAFQAGFGELKTIADIDRMEFRAEDRVWKVLSKDGYREVQIDAVTGRVLSRGQRTDQFVEDIHDFSLFADFLHEWGLPATALALFFLSLSGVAMFFVPVFRRWNYQRSANKN